MIYPKDIRPIRANFEITNLCNLRCLHCYFYSRNIEQIKFHKGLSLIEIKNLIKKLQHEGIFEFSIGGGEPFCFSEINEILLLSTKKMFTEVSTNGLLLDNEKINFLKNLSNFSLQISLDGRERTHKLIRNINTSSFNFLKKVIKKCVKAKINLKIGFMLCHLNVDDVDYICKFCLKNNIKNLTILPYIGKNKRLQLTTSDLSKAIFRLRKYRNHPKLSISIRDPFLSSIILEKKGYCEAGRLTFNIDYLGNVSPCCYLENSNIGNIFELKIKDIPSICSKKFKKILENRNLCPAGNFSKNFLRYWTKIANHNIIKESSLTNKNNKRR